MTISLELHNYVNSEGLSLIQIKVNNKEKRERISTKIYVKRVQFNKDAKYGKWIKESHPDARNINQQLEKKLTDAKKIVERTGSTSAKSIVKTQLFFEYAYEFIERYNNKKSQGTYRGYKAKLAKFKKFAGPKLTFNEINVALINRYTIHLKDIGNSINGYSVDLKKIKAILRDAFKENIITWEQNPFLKIPIRTQKVKKQKLTIEELNAIRELNLKNSFWLSDARNIFLFCLNMQGMRIGDALTLKHSNLVGKKIIYNMRKTGERMEILINGEVKEILSNYNNKYYIFSYLRKGDSEFDAIKTKTSLINKALKEIAKMAEIEKRITTHISKHTFAKMARKIGGGSTLIQNALGHATFQSSQTYVNDVDQEEIDELNQMVYEQQIKEGIKNQQTSQKHDTLK
jgi:integrase/recombinase XerD